MRVQAHAVCASMFCFHTHTLSRARGKLMRSWPSRLPSSLLLGGCELGGWSHDLHSAWWHNVGARVSGRCLPAKNDARLFVVTQLRRAVGTTMCAVHGSMAWEYKCLGEASRRRRDARRRAAKFPAIIYLHMFGVYIDKLKGSCPFTDTCANMHTGTYMHTHVHAYAHTAYMDVAYVSSWSCLDLMDPDVRDAPASAWTAPWLACTAHFRS